MVQLEEVEDQELDQAQPGPIPDSAYDSADFTDTGKHTISVTFVNSKSTRKASYLKAQTLAKEVF